MGAYARLGDANGSRARVVGIVGDVRNRGLGDATQAEEYLPVTITAINPMHFVVRSRLPASTLVPEIRRSVRSVAPSQPIYEVRTMREIVLGSVMNERLQSLLTAFFASAALLMAALGVYGVVSYAVRHRTVEIGTRMALGAVGRDVLRLVLGDGLENGGVRDRGRRGSRIAAVFLLKSEIFGIRIDNPLPFLFSTGIVAGITALACFFPGWRATLVAPMAAIRDDPGSIWSSAHGGGGEASIGFDRRLRGRSGCVRRGVDGGIRRLQPPCGIVSPGHTTGSGGVARGHRLPSPPCCWKRVPARCTVRSATGCTVPAGGLLLAGCAGILTRCR